MRVPTRQKTQLPCLFLASCPLCLGGESPLRALSSEGAVLWVLGWFSVRIAVARRS